MNPQLAALFAQHKTAILAGGAAVVAGVAYLQRKKSPAAARPVAATAGVSVPGTIPAAAVAGPTAGYDSSSYDVYNALQSELGQITQLEQQRQTVGAGAGAAPAPVASSLFAPVGTGHYVINPNGTEAEVESDGSLYAMQSGEFAPYYNNGARATASIPNDVHMYSLADNLKHLQAAGGTAGS